MPVLTDADRYDLVLACETVLRRAKNPEERTGPLFEDMLLRLGRMVVLCSLCSCSTCLKRKYESIEVPQS